MHPAVKFSLVSIAALFAVAVIVLGGKVSVDIAQAALEAAYESGVADGKSIVRTDLGPNRCIPYLP